jgi:hypothetical protein
MTKNESSPDPIEAAIEKATEGLDASDRRRFAKLVREGLERRNSSADAETLAEDIEPAGELDPDGRTAWAEAFALEPEIRALNRRALDLVKDFRREKGTQDRLRDEAEAIGKALDEIDLDGLDDDDRKRLQRMVGEARIDVRHVLSDGEGPRSLRAGRLDR